MARCYLHPLDDIRLFTRKPIWTPDSWDELAAWQGYESTSMCQSAARVVFGERIMQRLYNNELIEFKLEESASWEIVFDG